MFSAMINIGRFTELLFKAFCIDFKSLFHRKYKDNYYSSIGFPVWLLPVQELIFLGVGNLNTKELLKSHAS